MERGVIKISKAGLYNEKYKDENLTSIVGGNGYLILDRNKLFSVDKVVINRLYYYMDVWLKGGRALLTRQNASLKEFTIYYKIANNAAIETGLYDLIIHKVSTRIRV